MNTALNQRRNVTMSREYLRDWSDPDTARRAVAALRAEMRRAAREPGSGVKMCHRQGKTAVYVSDDGLSIIHHAPDGTITRKPRKAQPRDAS